MDIRLYTKEKGEGEPLILLHGNGESSDYFVHQMDYFSKKYHVIALDTRGHGRSPRGRAPFTIRQFAEDLREFMDMYHIERANILGFSDGGNIALVFALKYPKRVGKLVLNGANLDASGVRMSIQLPIEIGYRIASHFAKKNRDALKKAEMLGLMVNDPDLKPEALSQLHVKTLVVAGTRDMIKKTHTRLIYESLPDAELAFIDGDHFIAHKNPAVFNRVVGQFLAGKQN